MQSPICWRPTSSSTPRSHREYGSRARTRSQHLHRDIFAVLEDLDTTEPLSLGDTRSFTFSAHVRGVELEAVVLARFNEQGQIVELKILGRPLPGLATLFTALPPRVSARRRGRLTGALVAFLTRPFGFVLRTADRLTPRFL